jgi:hypothetical protein
MPDSLVRAELLLEALPTLRCLLVEEPADRFFELDMVGICFN